MSQSASIVLTATGVSFTNEWVQTNNPNFRILVAGGALSLLFTGLEKLNEQAAKGLSVIMFITILVTPFHGKSPFQTLADLTVAKPGKG